MHRTPRILTLTKFYFPYRGGIETVVKNITDYNNRGGYQSDVLCANTEKRSEISLINGSKVQRSAKLLTLKSTSLCPYMPWQLKQIQSEYDLIHVHFPDPMTALCLFLMKPAKPIIVHWHSDIIKQRKLMSLFGPLQQWCLDEARVIMVTSESYAKHSEYLKRYQNKIQIVPIGIESDNKPKAKSLTDKKTILSVGRLTEYKGFKNLIMAAKLLPDNFEIRIVGDGELKDSLQSLIHSFNLESRVHLLGSLNGEDLQKEYDQSTVFCLPSTQKSEAFGVVLLEAMSHSLPVLACNIEGSGVPWVNEAGMNVEPNNPQALADGLLKITSSQELYTSYSKACFDRFSNHFRVQNMMERIWESYRILLS